ncbi:MAG: AMP-dependent synthetase [Alphaproteobacteria bacterium]|nr:AMP-dependent synthetase [Alphaproteobacteria bacterium]
MASQEVSSKEYWSKEIAVETVNGIPFRVYSNRPRRVESLLSFSQYWSERPYIIQGQRIITHHGLTQASRGKGHELGTRGVKPGDHVFIVGWNSPEWIINFWACLQIGAVPVLGNSWWSTSELNTALTLIKPSLILADRHCAEKIDAAVWPLGHWHWDENHPISSQAQLEDHQPAEASENDPAAIIFTSGTSGQAKAVVLAHRSLLSNPMMTLHVTRKLPYVPDVNAGDIALHTGPLFHIGGLQALMRAVLVGNTLVFGEGRFDAGETLKLIEKYRIVRWSAVPTMVTRILEHPDLPKHDISSLVAMTLGGTVVTAEFFERIRSALPNVQARIATGYGLSENGGQASTASGKETIARPGTCGRAMPLTEIKIMPVPGLAHGEIWVRSPTQMLGYYGTQETPIDREGWLQTGDLGTMDADGFIWITGRLKDIIIRGGENIAPAAVEAVLTSLSFVKEAVVFGVPHSEWGEEVMAVVVVDGAHSEDQLKREVREHLASFAIPSQWLIQTDPLPVNQTGKVDKPAIRASALAALAQRRSG